MSHEVYLEKLKGWLAANRFPKDFKRLEETVAVLDRLDVRLDETARTELREMLATTFDMSPFEMDAFMPSRVEEAAAVLQTRPPMPELPGYVGAYIAAMSGHESPDSFHAFSLMTSVGAALGRRVWVDQKWYKVWPNLSVVLAGPAGGPKKSAACDMGLASVKSGFRGWKPKLIVDASPQAIVKELDGGGGDSVGFIYAPEFRHFFPSAKFMEGSVPLITRLLDNPDDYPVSRVTRQGEVLRNVTLSMKGGSTLDWLGKLPSDAQGGGFFTRVLIIYEERAKERGRDGDYRAAIKALQTVNSYAGGETKMSRDGQAWFDDWKASLKKANIRHPRLVLYYNRKHVHLLRVAMLLHLPQRVLGPKELQTALALLDWIEAPLADVYKLIGMSKTGEITREVLSVLRANDGKMGYSALMRELKGSMNRKDFKLAVETLKEAGQVKEIRGLAEHTLIVRELGLVE